MSASLPVPSYYQAPAVRDRIREFVGRSASSEATACYLGRGETIALHLHEHHPVSALDALFADGAEIARSLWDSRSLIADLDVEYVNFDDPAEAFLHPERAFELQEPVRTAIEALLASYGIEALHLLSGRGHHYLWQIGQDSPACARLTTLGQSSANLQNMGEGPRPELVRAFAGLGQVMEFVAGRVREKAAPDSRIPIELTAIEVGPSDHGREMVSLDVSEYGDPLAARMVRVPFSVYLKPWQQRGLIEERVLQKIEPLFVIPAAKMNLEEALFTMRRADKAARLAATVHAEIPEASAGMGRLIAAYGQSSLGQFHREFYSQTQETPERWPETYDRVPLEVWPPCARFIIEHPNDLLLRPSCIRRIVHVLLALGWHPRHIAGLIRSKYERDFGWTQLADCDPVMRAEFYVRIFAGLFVTGCDDLIDFNCTSAREEGLCFFTNCNDNLLRFRKAALYRRAHDKLAHRPFNRLLLPAAHP